MAAYWLADSRWCDVRSRASSGLGRTEDPEADPIEKGVALQ